MRFEKKQRREKELEIATLEEERQEQEEMNKTLAKLNKTEEFLKKRDRSMSAKRGQQVIEEEDLEDSLNDRK